MIVEGQIDDWFPGAEIGQLEDNLRSIGMKTMRFASAYMYQDEKEDWMILRRINLVKLVPGWIGGAWTEKICIATTPDELAKFKRMMVFL